VYLITDRASGKHYVGSAYGTGGIWERWACYALTGHGNNVELEAVLQSKGPEYAQNFQFAILEICDINSSPEQVVERESHWKTVLKSREFGLNKN
jgi:hypothetical protein